MNVEVNENLLQFIFQYKLFNTKCQTVDGKEIEVVEVGQKNEHEGPDFIAAKIKIENVVMVGNVEIDLSVHNWRKHGHDKNTNYNNVILHVIWDNDVAKPTGDLLTLEIKNFVPKILLTRYQNLMSSTHKILCHNMVKQNGYDKMVFKLWQPALVIERLKSKTETIKKYLSLTNNNWEQVFFIMLMKNFGYTANEQIFEDVAIKTDIKIFAKNKQSLETIIAILLGQANIFSNNKEQDDFTTKLVKEYQYQKHKYSLSSSVFNPQYGKMRPFNFPSIRLAQMASLIFQSSHLLSKILETADIKKCIEYFNIDIHPYFKNHFVLGKNTNTQSDKKLGKTFIQNILINTIIPTIFIYGEYYQKQEYKERALEWLEKLPSESNNILSLWEEIKIKALNATDSQCLIGLYKNYCQKKRCLECKIGYQLLNATTTPKK